MIELIKIGAAGFPDELEGNSIGRSLEELERIGFDSLELQFLKGIDLEEEDIEEYKKFSKGISFSAHAPYLINLSSSDQRRIKESLDWIMRSARVLNELKGDLVVFHPGYYAVSEEETMERIKRNLERVLERLESESLNVEVGIETTAKEKQFGRVDEVYEVCNYFNFEVKPVLDFAHIHAKTSGGLRSRRDFEKVLRMFKGNLSHFHFHLACVEYENREEVSHQPFSAEEPDYKPLINILKSEDIDSNLILESPQPLKDLKKIKAWIQE